MNHWIKLTATDGNDVIVRESEISRFVRIGNKTTIYLTSEGYSVSVKESVDEIMKAIEGDITTEKPEKVQDMLTKGLKKAKEECLKRGNRSCNGCKSQVLCIALSGTPQLWNIENIVEAIKCPKISM